MTVATLGAPLDHAADLDEAGRRALRELILTLADSKRLLGIRYSDWMLRAPTLETGIAGSSMAQDEWGHGRLTYALLSDFGDDPKQLEHQREAVEYRSIEVFDRPFASWPEMIAACLLLDTALSIQYGALVESRYAPVHNRVQKMLDEEIFHFQYAAGWALRLAGAEVTRQALGESLARFLPLAMRWLGRPDYGDLATLYDLGLTRAKPDELRARFLARVGPVLEQVGLADDLGLTAGPGGWSHAGPIDWSGWDDSRRRGGGAGPDEDTLARVRGDKNRAMLLD